jgi:CheY-like chemotaxis protein/anti-sigma regulatory factor (Ser/Thr protein kinase)
MGSILVVDDSLTQAQQVVLLLEEAGYTVATAGDGAAALALLAREEPDVVVTDLQMPGMNGLELVEAMRTDYPLVPAILMTAHGSEEIAIQALRQGAASYVPKKNLTRDLVDTVARVLTAAQAARAQQRLFECLTHVEHHFVLENDTGLIGPLVSHLSEAITRRRFCDANGLLRLTVAWSEALLNAMHHGNLEAPSELRQSDERVYHKLVEQRRGQEPYAGRRVHVTARLGPEEAVYVIRDEGPGFDPSTLPDPTDPANLERVGGRGLLLIRTFMDRVSHNECGNEITMSKRRRS